VPLVPQNGGERVGPLSVLQPAAPPNPSQKPSKGQGSSMNAKPTKPTQGPIQMTKAEAVELSDISDDLTHLVEQRIRQTTRDPLIQQEMRRVIAIQLIEAKYGAGRNHERLGDDPER